MSRPVLAMGPIPGYVTPMRSAPYSINNNSGYIIQPYVNGPIYKSVDMMNPMNAMNHMQMNGMNTSQGYDEQHQFIPQRPFWGGEYNDPYIGGQQQ